MTQETIIENFYKAFQQLDAETMVSYYHDDIVFTDPGFGTLHGEDAKNMWRMLCERAQNFTLTYSKVTPNSAHWEPTYIFSTTQRKVHNIIDASFEFKDGKIIRHIDDFNLHRWARQALGFKGKLLGGTLFFQKKLQRQTKTILAKYTHKKTSS